MCYYSERGDRLIDLAVFHDKLWQVRKKVSFCVHCYLPYLYSYIILSYYNVVILLFFIVIAGYLVINIISLSLQSKIQLVNNKPKTVRLKLTNNRVKNICTKCS